MLIQLPFFRESITNFSKASKSCGGWLNQASLQNIRNFEGIIFLENIRNFFRIDFFYFMLGVGKRVISLHIPLLISQINLSSI